MQTEDMRFEDRAVVLWFIALGLSTGLITGVMLPYPIIFTIGIIGNLICWLILLSGIYLHWRDKE